jgi:superfamily II helicase
VRAAGLPPGRCRALLAADVIITTPEKWDGISRAWKNRGYVKHVGLLVIDEIHLLGADRGPILEVIVSRMRYVATQTRSPVRFVGLSTALANAQDLAEWLGIRQQVSPSVGCRHRRVPGTCARVRVTRVCGGMQRIPAVGVRRAV